MRRWCEPDLQVLRVALKHPGEDGIRLELKLRVDRGVSLIQRTGDVERHELDTPPHAAIICRELRLVVGVQHQRVAGLEHDGILLQRTGEDGISTREVLHQCLGDRGAAFRLRHGDVAPALEREASRARCVRAVRSGGDQQVGVDRGGVVAKGVLDSTVGGALPVGALGSVADQEDVLGDLAQDGVAEEPLKELADLDVGLEVLQVLGPHGRWCVRVEAGTGDLRDAVGRVVVMELIRTQVERAVRQIHQVRIGVQVLEHDTELRQVGGNAEHALLRCVGHARFSGAHSVRQMVTQCRAKNGQELTPCTDAVVG